MAEMEVIVIDMEMTGMDVICSHGILEAQM